MKALQVPGEVFEQAYLYIAIILGGMLATSLYNMCAGLLRALGDSCSPLYFLIVSSLINLVLDILFIAGFHTGIWGVAALATVLAQILSVLFCALYIWKRYREWLPQKQDFAADRLVLWDLISTGFSMAVMLAVFHLGSVVLQSAINHLGSAVITAHTAAKRIIDMLMQPLTAIATANSTFTSQNWGAQKCRRIKDALCKSLALEIVWALSAAIAVLLFGRQMVSVLIGQTEKSVLDNAVMNLRINFICFPMLGVVLCLCTAMQSMGSKIIPIVSSGIEMLIKPVSVFVFLPHGGYFEASLTEPLTWVACCIFLSVVYLLRDHPRLKQKERFHEI